MKVIHIAAVTIALCLSAAAHADTAIYDITLNNVTHVWTGRLSSYTRNATDTFILRINGVAKATWNAGAHRGYTYSPDTIGYEIQTAGGGGGGGGGGNKEHGPVGGDPNEAKFSINFTDSRTGVTSSWSLNISFMTGSVSFTGTHTGGYSFSSYTPATASTTWSTNGDANLSLWSWGYDKIAE